MHKMKALPVRQLSSILEVVAAELRRGFGLTKLAVGGGSAPALLDHLFSGSALRMRDFDLVLVADRPVDKDLAVRIGEALDSPDLRFLPRYVYPRRRSRGEPELWLAGWGCLWDVHGTEVDLSIFHDEEALSLNGLMNVDRILIPLPAHTSLNGVAAEMLTGCSADTAIRRGLAIDPCGGYESWVQRSPQIVAWNAIRASPIECSVRIVRTCASKLLITRLHPEMADPLRLAIAESHDRGDRFIRVRTLVKLLHDDRAGAELEMMQDLGIFKYWLPEIGDKIQRLGQGGLTTLFAKADLDGRGDVGHHAAFAEAGEQGADEVSASRLEALLLTMAPGKRVRILEEIAIAEPTFASVVYQQLPLVAKRRVKRTRAPQRRATQAAVC